MACLIYRDCPLGLVFGYRSRFLSRENCRTDLAASAGLAFVATLLFKNGLDFDSIPQGPAVCQFHDPGLFLVILMLTSQR